MLAPRANLESLPAQLSDFDLERFVQLTAEDIQAVSVRFRSDRRILIPGQCRVLDWARDAVAAVPPRRRSSVGRGRG